MPGTFSHVRLQSIFLIKWWLERFVLILAQIFYSGNLNISSTQSSHA